MNVFRALKKVFLLVIVCFAIVLSGPQNARAQGGGGGPELIAFLNQAISWYRLVESQRQLASEPADVVFLNDSQDLARQVLRLCFDFARADAVILGTQQANASSADTNPGNTGQSQADRVRNLTRLAAQAQARLKRAQDDLELLERRVPTAQGRTLITLRSQIAEARSEVQLAQARSDTLNSFIQFLSAPGTGGAAGLTGQIEELERSLPELRAEPAPKSGTAASAAGSTPKRQQPTGVMALASDLLALTRKLHTQREVLAATNALRDSATKLRSPLRDELKAAAAEGEQLSDAPDTTDPTALAARTQQIDALTLRFRQVAAAAVPLGKSVILLDSSRANSTQWLQDTEHIYALELRTLGIRLAALVLAIAAIFIGSEFWRRATYRYVHEARRRNQFMLLRRVIVAAAITGVVLFTLITEVGSLATFAGFITAGLAIALQNVILSVVAYFFLIGKYGIRVGDRVQISGITGDVIDIGLVRLHLLEVEASGAEEQPTGRVVVFSNSVVFQPTASFFKQTPGTSFGWRRVTLTLAPETDYTLAEKRLMDAVEEVFSGYREEMERQYRHMQQSLSISVKSPQPQSRMRISDSGLEMIIRYPAPLDRLSYVDDQVTRRLVQAITAEPRLRLAGAGTPNIQPVADVPKSPAGSPGVLVNHESHPAK